MVFWCCCARALDGNARQTWRFWWRCCNREIHVKCSILLVFPWWDLSATSFYSPWLRQIYVYIYIYVQYCTIFKVLIILQLGFASVSCFSCRCCGVAAEFFAGGITFDNPKLRGGCPQDTQPPLLCLLASFGSAS